MFKVNVIVKIIGTCFNKLISDKNKGFLVVGFVKLPFSLLILEPCDYEALLGSWTILILFLILLDYFLPICCNYLKQFKVLVNVLIYPFYTLFSV